jgi:hypothetical protein
MAGLLLAIAIAVAAALIATAVLSHRSWDAALPFTQTIVSALILLAAFRIYVAQKRHARDVQRKADEILAVLKAASQSGS